MATRVVMPQLGESVVEGQVSQWLKKEGDVVKQHEPILEVETDKVTTGVTATASGTLLKILVAEGLVVKAGTVLAVIGEPGETVPEVPIMPAPSSALPGAPLQLPGDELMPLSSMRRSIGEHMLRSQTISPHVTTVLEADLARVVAHREANRAAFERDGARLTFTPYFVAASAAALKTHPQVNSSYTDAGLVLHKPINIGVAVSLGDEGLIVPVIKGADGKSLLELARAVNGLAERARKKQLKPDDVVGGTFAITNHGIGSSLFSTPIIPQPNVAILGVGVIQKRAVVIGDAIVIRPMVYIGVTFDHRVLDGASGDAFAAKIKETLENWA